MSALEKKLPASSIFAGVTATLAVCGTVAAILIGDRVPFEIVAPPFIIAQILISAWFSIIGFKKKVHLMPIWIAAFFIFFPPATVIFWFFNRSKEFRVLH